MTPDKSDLGFFPPNSKGVQRMLFTFQDVSIFNQCFIYEICFKTYKNPGENPYLHMALETFVPRLRIAQKKPWIWADKSQV
jgi:hypothetical protein